MDLPDLRYVQRADVYKSGALAGHLVRETHGALAFSYVENYSGQPVASTLLVEEGKFRSPGGGLPPFFAGLLPEGHRLTVLQRASKTSWDDELTLLLAVGADVPGDVQIVPTEEQPTEPQTLAAEAPEALDFSALAEAVDAVSIPGVQSKTSASMMNTPLALAGRRAILKLDPPQHPHLVLNEATHLRAATAMRISVARAEVVHDIHSRPGLLVERFDRLSRGGMWTRLAMEDAAQLMNLLPAAKYQVSSEDVVLTVLDHVRAKPVAARNLYLQFVFAWLTGNGDLHAKNISVVESTTRGFSVAPMYDLPCTLLYGDDSMALTVAGRTTRLRARHWAEFADAIGLPQRAATSANALALKAASAVDLSELPFEGSPLTGAQRELRHRRYQLDTKGL